ncbi:XdhC family protein [Marinobacter sp.]|uniref:XdhC family protein n=1 Tax=Marinobacter sp. TaxID=50741 RepID=UPI000C43E182|nr:XdhC family protein [Marinobacter sp.]MBE94866.1 XshC-Cox1 family protein [Marinobacter sp.]
MQSLDARVVEQAIEWLGNGRTIWLCTVLSTFGSSPREPGSLMVATSDGHHLGSLSGGCVEEDFLERVAAGEYEQPAVIVRYGDPGKSPESPRIRLPCGGILDVLVERMAATQKIRNHLERIQQALSGQRDIARHIRLADAECWLSDAEPTGPRVLQNETEETVAVRIGPVAKLILAGYSTVSEACAQFALSLGYEVVLCDPREEVTNGMSLPPGIEFLPQLPSLYIASPGACTPSTAVVAATHDPRIDDLAMMAAVKTSASYIGVMGSVRTSQARSERLRRTGGLSREDVERIQMPIGLNLGSKTPSEIALAIVADMVRVRRGRPRVEL